MKNKIISAIEQHRMLENTNTVVIAVSGGADSVLLLHLLDDILNEKNIKLIAAHINHNLRGEESIRDEQFVKQLCKAKNIPLFIKSINIAEIAKRTKKSLEMAGRDERYNFLNQILKDQQCDKIATAHNLNDSFETAIFNLTRGTGISGIRGILPVRDNIIRPLIYISKEEILKYCEQNSIKFIVDSSNLYNDYNRNKIRNCVVPVLQEINPKAVEGFKATGKILENENLFLEKYAKGVYDRAKSLDGSLDISILTKEDTAIIYRVIKILTKRAISFDKFTEIEQKIYKDTPQKIQITETEFIKIIYNKLFFYQEDNECRDVDIKFKDYDIVNNLEINSLVDYDKIDGNIIIRTRQTGDVVKINGHSKTLKKLMIEKKIPSYIRNDLLVAECKSGIFYVEGIGVLDGFKANKFSANIKKF